MKPKLAKRIYGIELYNSYPIRRQGNENVLDKDTRILREQVFVALTGRMSALGGFWWRLVAVWYSVAQVDIHLG